MATSAACNNNRRVAILRPSWLVRIQGATEIAEAWQRRGYIGICANSADNHRRNYIGDVREGDPFFPPRAIYAPRFVAILSLARWKSRVGSCPAMQREVLGCLERDGERKKNLASFLVRWYTVLYSENALGESRCRRSPLLGKFILNIFQRVFFWSSLWKVAYTYVVNPLWRVRVIVKLKFLLPYVTLLFNKPLYGIVDIIPLLF